jgi:hypothetical protein
MFVYYLILNQQEKKILLKLSTLAIFMDRFRTQDIDIICEIEFQIYKNWLRQVVR